MIYKMRLKGLSHSFKPVYERFLNELLDSAPSESVARSAIVRSAKGYLGVIDIFSTEGRFRVKASAKNLEMLIQNLMLEMTDELWVWKQQREVIA